MAQDSLVLPGIPQEHFLHGQENTAEAQVLTEIPTQPMFFLERIDVNPEGGYLCYKFAAEVEFKNEVHTRTVDTSVEGALDAIGNEEDALGFIPESYNVGVCPHCNKATVRFVPKPVLKNRVNLLYPTEGWTEPQILVHVNQAKRLLVTFLGVLTIKEVAAAMGLLAFLPWKRKVAILERLIQETTRLIGPVLGPVFLKDEFYLPFTIEMRRLVSGFLKSLGVEAEVAQSFAYQFSILLEFDSQYRHWIVDIATETTKEKLGSRPYREAVRLLGIFKKRLHPVPSEKYGNGEMGSKKTQSLVKKLKPVLLILALPKVKKALRQALETVDLSRLQINDIYRHEFLRVEGYDYMGRSIDDRYEEYLSLYNGKPPIPTRYGKKQEPVGTAN